MRSTIHLLALLLTVMVIPGCRQAPTPSKLNKQRLESCFVSAEKSKLSVVEKAVMAIRAEEYSAAADLLHSLLKGRSVTQEQKKAISEIVEQLSAYPRSAT